MYKEFEKFMGVEKQNNSSESKLENSKLPLEINKFIKRYGGCTFKNGLYRVHKADDIKKWNDIITEAHQIFKDKVICFGYDWLGRQFAVDCRTDNQKILMFEPGTGQVLLIPCSFVDFHNKEIIEQTDACLAINFFNMWMATKDSRNIDRFECVGYKIPLFLGGVDDTTNLEICDMEVYWGISSQLIVKT